MHSILSRLFIALLAITLMTPVTANAVINKKKTVTWNMQGSGHGNSEKWTNAVRNMIDGLGHIDILALQEAGTPPPSASVDTAPVQIINPDGLTYTVQQLIWRPGGSRGNPIYIYYLNLDLTRVSVAMVTTQRPDSILVFENPNVTPGSTARQVLGLRYGTDDYYTYHAGAYTNNEAGMMLQHIYQYYQYTPTGQNYQWMVLGDWNRSPVNLRQELIANYNWFQQNLVIYSQGAQTQQSGGNLDYAVIGQVNMNITPLLLATLFIAQLAGYLASDHTPVFFR